MHSKRLLSALFMTYFPADSSLFTADFTPASWFSHVFLLNPDKNFIIKKLFNIEII